MLGLRYAFKVVSEEFIRDISTLGGLGFYILLIVFSFLVNEIELTKNLIIAQIGIFVGAYTIKLFYVKPRPDFKKKKFDSLLERLNESSFPSIHAARISVLSAAIYSLFNLPILSAVLILLVDYSRIRLNRHFMIDIIAGTIMGLIIGYYVFVI